AAGERGGGGRARPPDADGRRRARHEHGERKNGGGGVDDVTSGGGPAMMPDALYAYYPVFRAPAELRRMDPGERDRAAHEFELALKELGDAVTLRGAYSCTGLRPDADLMLWLVAPSPDAAQDALVALRRTRLGRELELTHSFMGLVRPAEFTPDHAPA